LWDQAHTFSDMIPGKLSLCHGMPVMLRHNWATELAMNKGQEGVVHDWVAGRGRLGQRVLHILYVRLVNAPRVINIPGLPENVVPCTPRSSVIECALPTYIASKKLKVTRVQVDVLPNFAMTDYASQGKTREFNVVDLKDCQDHHAYYVALSRGMTSDGTIVLREFEPSKIQGGCSGALRQEFRDLEILNDITRLRYEGRLPETVVGHRRIDLISSFREWKGAQYMPEDLPRPLRWTTDKALYDASGVCTNPTAWMENDVVPLDWQIISADKRKRGNLPKMRDDEGFVSLKSLTSTVRSATREVDVIPVSQNPLTSFLVGPKPLIGRGSVWNNNSCAYDCVASAFAWIFTESPGAWLSRMDGWSPGMNVLIDALRQHVEGGTTELNVTLMRDSLRAYLQRVEPAEFVAGEFASAVAALTTLLKTSFTVLTSVRRCRGHGGHPLHGGEAMRCIDFDCPVIEVETDALRNVGQWFSTRPDPTNLPCLSCGKKVRLISHLVRDVPVIVVSSSGKGRKLTISFAIRSAEENQEYTLKAVIYFGADHFTLRVVKDLSHAWYYDGMKKGSDFVYEGLIDNINLRSARGREAVAAIYTAGGS
ncbi:hypothetical protein FB107DRAFT_222526, partial [Schizophyllum commune]